MYSFSPSFSLSPFTLWPRVKPQSLIFFVTFLHAIFFLGLWFWIRAEWERKKVKPSIIIFIHHLVFVALIFSFLARSSLLSSIVFNPWRKKEIPVQNIDVKHPNSATTTTSARTKKEKKKNDCKTEKVKTVERTARKKMRRKENDWLSYIVRAYIVHLYSDWLGLTGFAS